MKFKTIFIIFNVIIIFSFLIIFLMPLILFGNNQLNTSLKTNWLALAIFLVVLAVFNFYFIRNFKLFSLLEAENWFDLISYLEKDIYKRHRFSRARIKILLNAYLVTSNTKAMTRLEQYLAGKNDHMIEYFSLQFGVPYLLNNDPRTAEAYFGRMLAAGKTRYRNWLRWNYALSLVQQNQYETGKEEFLRLLPEVKNPILLLLTVYILKSFTATDPEIKANVEAGIKKLHGSYNVLTWRKLVEQQKQNIQVLVLSRIIEQAGDWLFTDAKADNRDPGADVKMVH